MNIGLRHYPFTISQGQYPRIIITPVEVITPQTKTPGRIIGLSSCAQWDTGADFCLISSELAQNLRLKSYGKASVNGVGAMCAQHNSYLVNLVLPNGIYFNDVLAIEDESLKATGVDFLIGLSVINELDFAISHNEKGESVLSISYPANRLIDFCREENA